MSPAGPSRKQARRDAVFLLYQTEVTDLPMADLVNGQKLREGYAPDEFTIKAVAGVLRERETLDAELEAHSRGWPLDRVAPLERSILRLALVGDQRRGDPAGGGHRRGRAPRQTVLDRRGRRVRQRCARRHRPRRAGR